MVEKLTKAKAREVCHQGGQFESKMGHRSKHEAFGWFLRRADAALFRSGLTGQEMFAAFMSGFDPNW